MTGLYERIKSLEVTPSIYDGPYTAGYRDALRAAATLALMQDALVVELVEALEAWLATDPSFNSALDRHLDELIAEGKSVRLATLVKLSRAALAKYKGEQP